MDQRLEACFEIGATSQEVIRPHFALCMRLGDIKPVALSGMGEWRTALGREAAFIPEGSAGFRG